MRFLITNHQIQSFSGSEINALQVGGALRAKGHEVEIGTFHREQPVADLFQRAGMPVYDLLEEDPPSTTYDVIWAHHAPLLTHAIFNRKISAEKILFSSLSPIEPLESPPAYFSEIHFFVYNSAGNKALLCQHGLPEGEMFYFPNFAPRSFFAASRQDLPAAPRRIAVVSNHVPPEVRGFAALAAERGSVVDFLGLLDRPVFVDERVLLPYDLVITIGKTVQYCFALKIPVYCYDRFGGPGYLDTQNFETAERTTFSGRLLERYLDAPGLTADIFDGYPRAVTGLDFLYRQARERFCLEDNLDRLLEALARSPATDLERIRDRYSLSARANEAYTRSLKHRLLLDAALARKESDIQQLLRYQRQKEDEIQQLLQYQQRKESEIQDFIREQRRLEDGVQQLQREVQARDAELARVRHSLLGRLYRFFTARRK